MGTPGERTIRSTLVNVSSVWRQDFVPSAFRSLSANDRSVRAQQLTSPRRRTLPCRRPTTFGLESFILHRSFNVVNANSAITSPAIQNRMMIFDSCQPRASK